MGNNRRFGTETLDKETSWQCKYFLSFALCLVPEQFIVYCVFNRRVTVCGSCCHAVPRLCTAVLNENGNDVQQWRYDSDREKPSVGEKNLYQCHFVHHWPRLKRPPP
jgi:hypothetical protein